MLKFSQMRNFKRFLHTTRDVFRIYWEIAPFITLGILITQILGSLQGFATSYMLGIFIDQTLKAVTTTKDIKTVLPITILLGVSFFIFDAISIFNNYLSSVLNAIDMAKIRLKQTDFMVKLGISVMENPELTNKSTRFNEVYSFMNQYLSTLVGLISLIVSTVIYGIAVFSFAPIIVLLVLTFFVFKFFNNGRFINKAWKLSLENTETRRNVWSSIGYLGDPASLKEILL